MPHRLSADTEEERRVFHVAITRASETVAITVGRHASRFVDEMRTAAQPEPARPATEAGETEPTRAPPRHRGPAVNRNPSQPEPVRPVPAAGETEPTRAPPRRRGPAVNRNPSQPEPAQPATGAGETDPAPAPSRHRGPIDPPEASTLDEVRLREKLKAWRSAAAKTAGVPAYVVFNDATLYELAAQRPNTDDELLSISGIGPVKLERYGKDVLAIMDEVS